ncbi:Gfo/Idh/MocA family oxidoreductase [Paenibacillus rhizovicinus]|uniref:Gfo/Idh/MocA family oxidoreductase n=1 Tax=Paenibacillus rhizovicinus TaxID=2704463 RepID=A0A6C0NU95_9BACL|nr:Gfo/Idh/MocA family oxidoreductase [Paenibacillus rhizovicinus]QHW29784.1 Gfo/Idh/MocA family oxidoreductase [Paenibacillus rhizovicinus]
MTKRIGIGVVGAGAIGLRGALTHLSQPDAQERVKLAAICDPVPGRAKAAAEKFGVDKAYESYEELLADPAVEIVTICTPIGLHYEQGLQALEAGKHIHFNKTMTTKVSEATDLIEKAAARNLQIVASPGMMLHPVNRRMRRLLLDGSLGQLAWAITGTSAGSGTYHLNEEYRTGNDILTTVNPEWYYKKPGGGPMYDVSVYALHNLTGILGPAKRITAMSGIGIPEHKFRDQTIINEMDDSTTMLLDFGNSFHVIVYTTIAGTITDWLPNVYGTSGAIIGAKFGDVALRNPADRQPHVNDLHINLDESHVYEDIMQLVDLVADGKPTIVTAEHARHVIDIIESGYRAAATGQTQELTTTFQPLTIDELDVAVQI